MDTSTTIAVTLAVMGRPWLWSTALRQVWKLAGRGWWKRPPFLPVPPKRYVRFRMVTAYGGDGSPPATDVTDDVITYLEWCRSYRTLEDPRQRGGVGAKR
ncbi:MAG: hypothetical protein ACR2OH_15295 [Microthrixaceae bacterium]